MAGGKKAAGGKSDNRYFRNIRERRKNAPETADDFFRSNLGENGDASPETGEIAGATDAFFEAREILKKTVHYLKRAEPQLPKTGVNIAAERAKQAELLKLKKVINLHDGLLFFPRRRGFLSLKPIRTPLTWQEGEFPVFRSRVRHVRTVSAPASKGQSVTAASNRFVHLSLLDPATGEYEKFELTDETLLSRNGTIYITNMNIVFRMNRNFYFHIPLYRMQVRLFYDNALEIKHVSGGMTHTDVFMFEDPEICRLTDVILQYAD